MTTHIPPPKSAVLVGSVMLMAMVAPGAMADHEEFEAEEVEGYHLAKARADVICEWVGTPATGHYRSTETLESKSEGTANDVGGSYVTSGSSTSINFTSDTGAWPNNPVAHTNPPTAIVTGWDEDDVIEATAHASATSTVAKPAVVEHSDTDAC